MNGLTKIRLINELNNKELRLGVVGSSSSWHNQYKDSAWIYAGSLPYDLSEGDVICVFSQYGEIVNINLIRDKKTGKSKGFAFICYEDQQSTILAVDNLNGTKIKGRQLRVDHMLAYKVPKEGDDIDELTMQIREKGVAPNVMEEYATTIQEEEIEEEIMILSDDSVDDKPKKKKHKKEKKKKKGLSFLKETPKEKEKKLHKTRRKSENSENPTEHVLEDKRKHRISSDDHKRHSSENEQPVTEDERSNVHSDKHKERTEKSQYRDERSCKDYQKHNERRRNIESDERYPRDRKHRKRDNSP